MIKLIPVGKAFRLILLSIFIVQGLALGSLLIYKKVKQSWMIDEAFRILAIVQTGPEKEALPTGFLAELLDLSVDRPMNLYRFDCKEARAKLLSCPVIKEATVRRIKPGTVYVDYTIRKPVAYLGDLSNTALDEEGVAFPFSPYYTPKFLPEIFLGGTEELDKSYPCKWGDCIQSDRLQLAWNVLQQLRFRLADESLRIQRIDVSRSGSSSYGFREIIVVLETRERQQVILRLNSHDYTAALTDYHLMKEYLTQHVQGSPLIVDLRIPNLAFVKEKE